MMKETVPFLFSASEPADRRHVQLKGLRSQRKDAAQAPVPFASVAFVFALQVSLRRYLPHRSRYKSHTRDSCRLIK